MIGQRLYELRVARGLSQKELGDILMISHHTVSSYEKDKSDPSDEIKVRIAIYFGVSVDYLVGLIDAPLPFERESSAFYFPRELTGSERTLLRDFTEFLLYRAENHEGADGAGSTKSTESISAG